MTEESSMNSVGDKRAYHKIKGQENVVSVEGDSTSSNMVSKSSMQEQMSNS